MAAAGGLVNGAMAAAGSVAGSNARKLSRQVQLAR